MHELESCESRFLWKNGSYLRTTWKTFTYHWWYVYDRLGTPVLDGSIWLKFLLETKLKSESFDTLDDLLGIRVQTLW